MKLLPIIAIFSNIIIANSATAQLIPSTPVKAESIRAPQVRILANGTKLRIYDGKFIQNIKANSLKIRILDSLSCDGKPVKRQTLSGKKFFNHAITLNKKTGDLAVGVLLQNCLKSHISAIFILQPKPNWDNYVIHRVPIPGEQQINNRFSSYPLKNIQRIGFRDGKLWIKHAHLNNSEALLVYTSSNRQVEKHAPCFVTQQVTNNYSCPND